MRKTYFLSPTRDHPPNGPIALGNLIKSPRSPEYPLNDPSSPTIKSLTASAHITHELDATRSLTTSLTLKPGIWASFLDNLGGFGIGPPVIGGLDFSIHRHDGLHYFSPKLTTWTINPSLQDIRAIFSEPDVQEAIRKSRFRANLYLVTGVQIAHGAEYIVSKVRERGGNLHVAADLGVLGALGGAPVPVTVGVSVEGNWRREERGGGRVSGDFVFAYCLREVVYRKKRVVEQRAPRRVEGDLMGLDGGDGDGDRDGGKLKGGGEAVFEAELAGLKEEDPELPEYWDMGIEKGVDLDGSECLVVSVDEDEEEEGEDGD